VPSHAPQQSFGAAFIVDDIVRQFARLLPLQLPSPDGGIVRKPPEWS